MTGDHSRVTSVGGGFSLENFRGLFNGGTQQPDRPAHDPLASLPVIDWGEEEAARPTPLALGGAKMKSSWLGKFLSATGIKADRATAQDFEVTLPGKHGKR